jgi:putative endonuclease
MAEHNILGKKGEEQARFLLKEKGYTIIACNWKHLKEEIDIIASRGEELVFVEVKTRSGSPLESPELAVSPGKQRSLVNAADAYIKNNNVLCEARFDVISVLFNKNRFTIDHIENAFYPTL